MGLGMEACGIHETTYNSITSAMLTSGRTCTPTPSCPEAPPCTPVLLSVCKGDHRPCSLHHQDQDHRSPREEVLCLDRRIHPGLPLHLPADVDLQAGVRRVRPRHRPPQVLLSCRISNFHCRLHSENEKPFLSNIPFSILTMI